MANVWGVLVLATLMVAVCSAQSPDEPCVKDAYPPDPNTEVPTYTVDLDQDPKLRWQKLVTDKKADIVKLIDYVHWLLSFIDHGKLIPIEEDVFGLLADSLPAPYGDEMRGISESSGLPLGDVVLYNVFYEIFSVCTSIVAESENGTLMHVRNLDFGLLMGWDIQNDTWPVAEMLRPIVVNVEYMKGGKLVYKAVHFAGYIGILSAIKPDVFTLTMNESYSEAVDMLANTRMLAPAYFIVGGTKSGEGCVITRTLEKALDIWKAGSHALLSKTQSSSKRQTPSLLQLAQPESWHQLHRDIQGRLRQGRSSPPHPLSPQISGVSATGGLRESQPHIPVLSEAVKNTLSNSPWTRTHRQVQQAAVELRVCGDFRDYPEPVQYSLCRVGWHLSLDQGRVIFREHAPACCFYFIISGNVLVTSDQEPDHTLTAGTSFGDESIIDKTVRTMTCSALTPVELLVISKSVNLSVCLSHWPLHLLESHPDQCKVANFKTNSVVVKDSTKNPWVYIIMTGSCRAVKRFVYGSEDQGERVQKRKSYSNPADVSKLAGESAGTRQPPATGILRQQMLLSQKKNKQPHLAQGYSPEQVQRKGHRLPHTISTPQISVRRPLPKKQFLLQLQLLKPKDTFGLSSFVYEDEPSVTLVSNGAEVVMLSKEFLHLHFKETTRGKLKHQISPFPSQETMLKRIRERYS
ncbi:Acid ceramidase [Geodia barretti]|uniref:ceramidase n=1 Tax=Geodia barretti TaxID=519541 RepID=A0AA35STX8_GEOBA|nr:Acid ceramidase [Geodia barretti]